MRPLGPLRPHFWLTLGMARATGIDLQNALYDARLTRSDYADLVDRCRGCKDAKGCAAMLKTCQGTLEAAPEFCENQAVFAALAA